jgi:hypothetical protein
MTPNTTAALTTEATAPRDREVITDLPAAPDDVLRDRARAAHPSGQRRRQAPVAPPYYPPYRRPSPSVPAALRPAAADGTGGTAPSGEVHPLFDEDGSLVTEYGLLAVVAATVAGVVIQWASGGALVTLFNALLRHARSLVGA